MRTLVNATDVRRDWGRFIDHVVREGPRFIKRSRDSLVVIETKQLRAVLAPFRFHMEAEREADGSFSGSIEEVDVVGNAPTREALKLMLAEELADYARTYHEQFALYFSAPNRRAHAPYVLHTLLQENVQSVAMLIDA